MEDRVPIVKMGLPQPAYHRSKLQEHFRGDLAGFRTSTGRAKINLWVAFKGIYV